ncbi:MAG: hypothetical protein ABJB61_12100, partial [bacterium]
MKIVVGLLLLSTLLIVNIFGMQRRAIKKPVGDPDLAKKIARFAPTTLAADLSKLSARDRQALAKIIATAKLLDPLFLRQVWSGNDALEAKLEADKAAVGRQRLHYFLINDGPWSRLDNNEPFIEGVPREKPPHANFYPDDITKDEFNSWLNGLSAAEKEKATGYCYVIR